MSYRQFLPSRAIAGGLVIALGIALAHVPFGSALAQTAGTPPALSVAPRMSPPVCWTPGELAATNNERRVRRMLTEAFVDPPQREPAPHTGLQFNVPPGMAVRRVTLPPNKKLVAFTFDLCEAPYEIAGYQGAIVDILRAHRVKATFFAGGKWIMSHDTRAQQLMSDPLFEIGNHGWEHRNLRVTTGQRMIDEIKNARVAYEVAREKLAARQCTLPDGRAAADVQSRLGLFRFPFGACSKESLDEVARQGLIPIQWDVSSGDAPPGQSHKEMIKDVLTGVRPGSIVLFHANGRGLRTEEVLPTLIRELRARGYEFVTVGELLSAGGTPELKPICYDKRPGDTDRYDATALWLETLYQRAKAQFASPADTSEARTTGAVPAATLEPTEPAFATIEHAVEVEGARETVNALPVPKPRPVQEKTELVRPLPPKRP